MEFQTNKETGTHSSNGKYNYAAKLDSGYMQIDLFHLCKDLMRFLKTEYECAVREDTFTAFRKCKNYVVSSCQRVRLILETLRKSKSVSWAVRKILHFCGNLILKTKLVS